MNKYYTFISILLATLLSSCDNDKVQIIPNSIDTNVNSTNCTDFSSISFSSQVQPILSQLCMNCHSQGASLELYNYSKVSQLALSGQLGGCLNGDQTYLQMPLVGSIDSCSIKIINNWILQGCLDN